MESQHTFPCSRLPEDAGACRLLGLYPQRQEGLWMQRLKLQGGTLSAAQWRLLAGVARKFTPGEPLHLTTRQDVEMHGLTAQTVPQVQAALAQAGLSGLGGCGDTLRNITVCPCSGTRNGALDVSGVAWAVRKALEALPGVYALPRKFKISFSACTRACGEPYINDLGFVAAAKDGRWGFEVLVGGSLGSQPGTAMRLIEWLAPEDVTPLAVAALKLFEKEGDRTNRKQARIRHVRERMGDGPFKEVLLESFHEERSSQHWPGVELAAVKNGFDAEVSLRFLNGDVTPEAAEAFASLSEREDIAVRIANDHRVVVFGEFRESLKALIQGETSLAPHLRQKCAVVACPGTRWCSRGIAATNDLARKIVSELGNVLPGGMDVRISGCPNGCAHSGVAAIGLYGGIAERDGERREAWRMVTGGNSGRGTGLAAPHALRLAPDEVIAEIRALCTAASA